MEDLTGKDFNGIKVLGFSHKSGSKVYWDLKCSCGKPRPPLRGDSLKKHTGKCTCPVEEGEIRGKLMYRCLTRTEGKRSYCEVSCECGNVYETRLDNFKTNINGCGKCINKIEYIGDIVVMDVSTRKYPDTYTVISKEDYSKVKHLKWYAIQGVRTLYVQASLGKERLSLHKYILGCNDDMVTDHEDGDGLNNVRSNLRKVDRKVNGKNVPCPRNNTTGCMGVSFTKGGKYRAYITVDDVQISLGTFDTFESAVLVRKSAEGFYNFHANHGRINNPTENSQIKGDGFLMFQFESECVSTGLVDQ